MPIKGLDELLTRLEGMAERMSEGVAAGLEAGLGHTVKRAKELAPVQTGRLRDSIGCAVMRDGGEVKGRVSASAEYAARVELGDAQHPPAPFLYPAFKQTKKRMIGEVREAVHKELRRR